MKTRLLAATCAALLFLTGCGSDDDSTSAVGGSTGGDGSVTKGSVLDRVSSCDQVESVVAPYVSALVLSERSTVDEWGVSCDWEMAEGETDMANNRSVSVAIVDNEEGDEAPDTSLVAKQEGYAAVDDPWVADQGGVAYSYSLGTAVAGVIVTTIWLPHAEINITGGTWGDYPALDGPAAVGVAKKLLG